MSIYMDLHIVPGVNAKDVADAHSMDVLMEKEHSCKCLTYWIDELRGYVFCLIDAPDKESVIELHTRAHGLVPNKIIEVEPSLVQAFLGRITDPENAYVTDNGLVILDDTSYRIIMHIQCEDPALLQQKIGEASAAALLTDLKKIARQEIYKNNGREVSNGGNELIASFVEGEKAVAAGMKLYDQFGHHPEMDIRISLHAGEPVMQSDKLFGDTVQLLQRLNTLERRERMVITAGIRELLGTTFLEQLGKVKILTPKDELFLNALFNILEAKYSEDQFNMDDCCRMIAMSQSQLYRKTTLLFNSSPNLILRNYRLIKAKEALRTSDRSVSQVSFDAGFASASYFTKCFKSYFGLLPASYKEQVQSQNF